MKSLRLFAPNFLTSLNLLSGALAIVFAFEGYVLAPVYLLLFAAVFDFLDGFVAKALKATSEFGKQMDSLADLVSFGFAPSVLLHISVLSFGQLKGLEDGWSAVELPVGLIIFVPFLFLVFAALRLARFNVMETAGNDFIGLPVPAATLFVVSFWLVINTNNSIGLQKLFSSIPIAIGIVFVLSFLMVSKIPMLSLKFEGIGFRSNFWRYIMIIGSLVLFVVFHIQALLFVMMFYLILSLLKIVFGIIINR